MCPFILLVSILRFPLTFASPRWNPPVMTVAHKQVWCVLGWGRIMQWRRNTSLYEGRILFLVNFLTHCSTVITIKQRMPKDWWGQITTPSLASPHDLQHPNNSCSSSDILTHKNGISFYSFSWTQPWERHVDALQTMPSAKILYLNFNY